MLYLLKERQHRECSKMQRVVWLIHSGWPTASRHTYTHTWALVTFIFMTSLYMGLLKTLLWLAWTMTDSWRSPKTSCPNTHMLSVCNVRGGNDESSPCQRRYSCRAEHNTVSSLLLTGSHIIAQCGKPRFDHTLRHPADCSTIWSYIRGGPYSPEELTEA